MRERTYQSLTAAKMQQNCGDRLVSCEEDTLGGNSEGKGGNSPLKTKKNRAATATQKVAGPM